MLVIKTKRKRLLKKYWITVRRRKNLEEVCAQISVGIYHVVISLFLLGKL